METTTLNPSNESLSFQHTFCNFTVDQLEGELKRMKQQLQFAHNSVLYFYDTLPKRPTRKIQRKQKEHAASRSFTLDKNQK